MAIATFDIDEAYLIGDWLEAFVWGVYTIMFGMTLLSIYENRKEGVNKFTTVLLVILYILATGHISLALVRLIQGFILYRDVIDPLDYFADISRRVNMAKDYLYITSLSLGDLVIVWRLYVVYGKNLYIAAFPALMCLAELGVGWSSISQWLAPTQNFEVMDQLGSTMYCLSLGVNVLLTLIIVARIWYMAHRTRQALNVSGGSYTRILILLIESGAFVAAAKIAEFVMYQLEPDDGTTGLNSIEIVYECMPQITGLAPTLIIYAVNKGFMRPDSYYSGHTNTSLEFTSPTDTNTVSHAGSTTLFTSMFASSDGERTVQAKSGLYHGTESKVDGSSGGSSTSIV